MLKSFKRYIIPIIRADNQFIGFR